MLTEFALAIPVLILLLMGGFELGRFIFLQQKLDRAVASVGDLVARAKTLTTAQLNLIFVAAQKVVEPFDLPNQGAVIVTFINHASGSSPTILWQRSGAGSLVATSTTGNPGGTITLPENFSVDATDSVVVTEIFYQYQPLFFDFMIATTLVQRKAYYRPRLVSTVPLD